MSNTIQPQDLRINNIVQHNEVYWMVTDIISPEPREDKRFDGKWVIGLMNGGMINVAINEIQPIELTEEILVKCGFVKSTDANWQYQLSLGGINMYCRYNTEWYFELGGIYMGSRPKYLNELQNIYHAILGRELDIKL